MVTRDVSIGSMPNWRASVAAGVIAGAVFVVLEMLLVPIVLGGSPWDPPRMIAAIVMGEGVLPQPGQPSPFDAGVLMVALLVHFALSIIYALILAAVIVRMSRGPAIGMGLLFGLVLYAVNFYGFTTLFPWFAMARNWVSVFAHLVFGLVTAWAYTTLVVQRVLRPAV
jgi:hypothetical protein